MTVVVAVLGSPSLISLMVFVDVKQHFNQSPQLFQGRNKCNMCRVVKQVLVSENVVTDKGIACKLEQQSVDN